jgi:penicillin-binding protein 1A
MSPRARRRNRRRRPHRVSKVLLGIGVVAAAVAIGVLSLAIWVLSVAAEAPSLDDQKPADQGSNSVVYAADGSRLGYVESDVIRTPIGLDEVPQDMLDATVAIEDERFYEHDGIDIEAIFRAAIENVEAGAAVQGGSTITQQLVRNLYIEDPEDTFERKIKEAAMAEELEDEHS